MPEITVIEGIVTRNTQNDINLPFGYTITTYTQRSGDYYNVIIVPPSDGTNMLLVNDDGKITNEYTFLHIYVAPSGSNTARQIPRHLMICRDTGTYIETLELFVNCPAGPSDTVPTTPVSINVVGHVFETKVS